MQKVDPLLCIITDDSSVFGHHSVGIQNESNHSMLFWKMSSGDKDPFFGGRKKFPRRISMIRSAMYGLFKNGANEGKNGRFKVRDHPQITSSINLHFLTRPTHPLMDRQH